MIFIDERCRNWCKFYVLLEVNEETPDLAKLNKSIGSTSSRQVFHCFSKFFPRTPTDASKTSAGSEWLDNDCYNSFQDCSGSMILIPGLYNETSTENQSNK